MNSPSLAIFLGPDKSGSTSIHRALTSHSQIGGAASKELFFFDRYFALGEDWYLAQFDSRPAIKVRLDVSHDYLFDVEALRRIASQFPFAKTFVCLRDPVDRLVSAVRYMQFQGRLRTDVDLIEAIQQEPELVDHGLYAKHLKHAYAIGLEPRVFSFDRLTTDSACFFGEILEWLEVPIEERVLVEGSAVSNPSVVARWPTGVRAGRRALDALRSRGKHRFAEALKASRVARLARRRAPNGLLVSDRELDFLHEAFSADLEQLRGLVDAQILAGWRFGG